MQSKNNVLVSIAHNNQVWKVDPIRPPPPPTRKTLEDEAITYNPPK